MSTSAPTIALPNNWSARVYQRPLFDYMFTGGTEGKRANCVWHRRSGKDSCSLNLTAVAAHQRVGTYWHMLPTLNQAKKVIWKNIDKEGRRMIDQAFPKSLRASTNSTDMSIEFLNGSIWQAVGSDNYDSLIGANPVGVVFSEYSVANPAAWDYIRPILRENGGWAIFIYTARGKNHGYKLFKMAQSNPKWFGSLLTVDDTGILTPEDIQEERDSGMDDEMVNQEYYCSFDAGLAGAFYAKQMEKAYAENRITDVPYDPSKPVVTCWDLGINDRNAIWFLQFHGSKITAIDYEEGSNRSLGEWIREVKNKPYIYSDHIGPHDLQVREYTSGVRRLETASSLGVDFLVAPQLPVLDGIDSTRALLNRMYFDATKCEKGITALENYQKVYDEANKTFRNTPLHNWASNGADSLRMLSVSMEMVNIEANFGNSWAETFPAPDTGWVI